MARRRPEAAEPPARSPVPVPEDTRFRALIEHSWDIIALLDADGKIQYVSPSTRHVLGYAPEAYKRTLAALVGERKPRMLLIANTAVGGSGRSSRALSASYPPSMAK